MEELYFKQRNQETAEFVTQLVQFFAPVRWSRRTITR